MKYLDFMMLIAREFSLHPVSSFLRVPSNLLAEFSVGRSAGFISGSVVCKLGQMKWHSFRSLTKMLRRNGPKWDPLDRGVAARGVGCNTPTF